MRKCVRNASSSAMASGPSARASSSISAFCYGADVPASQRPAAPSPTRIEMVPVLTDVDEIWPSYSQSCARMKDGELRCWYDEQFDDGGSAPSPAAVPLAGVRHVTLGYFHACALLEGDEVVCWGRNARGQLGDGTEHSRMNPERVTFPE